MKNCRSLILGIALLALPLMGVASAQNLLPNGDFETGDLTGWQVFNNSPSATVTVESPGNGPSFPGMHHVFMNNEQPGLGLVLKGSTPVGSAGEGTVYYFVDLLMETADAGGLVFIQVFAEEGPDGGVIGGTGLLGPFTGPIGQWQVVQGTFEAPVGTSYLTFEISATTGANIDPPSICRARLDNFYLSQEAPPVSTEEMSLGSIKALYR